MCCCSSEAVITELFCFVYNKHKLFVYVKWCDTIEIDLFLTLITRHFHGQCCHWNHRHNHPHRHLDIGNRRKSTRHQCHC